MVNNIFIIHSLNPLVFSNSFPSYKCLDFISYQALTFYTDIVNTYDKMKSAGVDVRLHVKKKMGPVYPLWPCPEGKEERKEIPKIINDVK